MHLGSMVRSWALCHPGAALSLGHCGLFPRATSPRPPLLKHGQDGPEPPMVQTHRPARPSSAPAASVLASPAGTWPRSAVFTALPCFPCVLPFQKLLRAMLAPPKPKLFPREESFLALAGKLPTQLLRQEVGNGEVRRPGERAETHLGKGEAVLGPFLALCAGLTPFLALWAVLGPFAAACAGLSWSANVPVPARSFLGIIKQHSCFYRVTSRRWTQPGSPQPAPLPCSGLLT